MAFARFQRSSYILDLLDNDFHEHFLKLSGPGNFCLVHVSLVPVLNVVGEQVNDLNS